MLSWLICGSREVTDVEAVSAAGSESENEKFWPHLVLAARP